MHLPAVIALLFAEAPIEICLGDWGSCADPYGDAAEEEYRVGEEFDGVGNDDEEELRKEEEES